MITTWGWGGYSIVTWGWGDGLYEVAPPAQLTYLGARISLIEIIANRLQVSTLALATKQELGRVIEETWAPIQEVNGKLDDLEERIERLRRQVMILIKQ